MDSISETQETQLPIGAPMLVQFDTVNSYEAEIIETSYFPLQPEFIKRMFLLNNPSSYEYDIKEDFKWFTSGEAKTELYKGQYIAIWKRRIVANASTAVEAKKLAKTICGQKSRPAIVYVPKDENSIL